MIGILIYGPIMDGHVKSVTNGVYERLRTDILACRLRPGGKLNIGEVAEQLAVSLGAVREALSKLSAEGLVVAEAGRGYQVTPVSSAELADLTRVRTEIDCAALRRSIERGDVEWEVGLVAAYHRLSRTLEFVGGDPGALNEAWAAAHAGFHAALVAACDSPWTLKVREMLVVQSERYRRLSILAGRGGRDLGDEHRRLMELALAHDADGAVAELTAHLSTTTEIVIAAEWQ